MNVHLWSRPRPHRRALRVLQRNWDVFRAGWRTDFLPPLIEPALYLGILGFGLGLYVQSVDGLPYATWLGPALMATTGMFSAFFECSYGSFVRMYHQKTYDAITATPVSLDDVVTGELVWAGTRAALNATMVLLVLWTFGVPQSPWVLVAPLVVFIAGFSFAAVGLLTTSVARTFDAFNFPLYLFITPMFFLSGTFVPLSALEGVPGVTFVAQMLPLTHAVALCRALSLGALGPELVWRLLWLLAVGLALSVYAINSMKRRLIP